MPTLSLPRRTLLLAALAAPMAACAPGAGGASPAAARPDPAPDFAALEARAGGRLGVAVLTQDGALVGWRADERFALCSTFKLPLAGVILREADRGRIDLDRQISYSEADLLSYAPVTRARVGEGSLSIRELAEAAQVTSDNTAVNLLLRELGGPAAFTAHLREMGDAVTRLDRMEPEMNLVGLGDARDTSTPAAMAGSALTLVTGEALSPSSSATLIAWMRKTETGLKRLRAGLPLDWSAGDKTGTGIAEGIANKYNDVAVAFPPGGPPLAIAAYYEGPGYFEDIRAEDEAVLAEAGRIAAAWIRAA